jgi:hypothetical protein
MQLKRYREVARAYCHETGNAIYPVERVVRWGCDRGLLPERNDCSFASHCARMREALVEEQPNGF